MFTPITLTGRVTADLELQTSANGTDYIQRSEERRVGKECRL